ncbi:MAG: glycosyltransferase family 4 protein [Sphingomonas bacterium]|nr:glycosyltransferase family 4 protein [Sphingomonas bacterium]
MTRVAFICADAGVPVFGRKGSSIHVQEVIRALVGQGATVELFATRRGGDPPADLAAMLCFDLPPPPAGNTRVREQAAMAANRALRAVLAERAPFDLVYERYSLWSHAAIDWAREQGVAGIVEVNAPLIEEQAIHRSLSDRAGAEASAGKVFAAASAIVAVSSGVAAYLERFGVDPDKVRVLSNGVDASRFSGLAQRSRGAGFTIGFIGTLKPWHGLDTLIAAAGLARDRGCPVRLLIVGDGPESGSLETMLDAAGLTRDTELTGAVDPARIPALLERMDVAVAPYPSLPDFYFSPLKIMEYMAAGSAIVASRIGDIDGLIEHEATGLLCPPGDAFALADALIRLCAEPATCARLGAAARAVAVRDLGWDRVAAAILDYAGQAPSHHEQRVAAC